MLGLVLCGGQSSRMGSDKGLLQPNVKTWAETTADVLAEQQLAIAYSINPTQLPYYNQFFATNDLIVDNASLQVHGPLLGLLSAHAQYPKEDLFVLACDMPLMQTSIIKELLVAYQQHEQYDAWLFKNHEEPEPLCAIYSPKALNAIFQLLQEGKLVKHSMKFMLEQINPYSIPLQSNQKKHFRNFNSHAEMNGL